MRKILVALILALFCFTTAYAQNIDELTKKAASGDVAAQYDLARIYVLSEDTPQNLEEAQKWFEKVLAADSAAVAKGDVDAAYRLGMLYQYGWGVGQDRPLALQFMLQAAESDHAMAQYEAGRMSALGYDGAQNYVEALKWYEAAASQGLPTAMTALANMYAKGLGTSINNDKAFEWYLKAAELGNNQALVELGVLYATGAGVNKDYAKTFEYWLKAAESGYKPIFGRLGILYYDGIGVKQNFNEAFNWMTKAGQIGDAAAIQNLGYMYYTGKGLKQDYAKAFEYLNAIKDKSGPDAVNYVAEMLITGRGTAQNADMGYDLLEQNALRGNLMAQYRMGQMYFEGLGLTAPANVKAYAWLELARINAQKLANQPQPAIRTFLGDGETYIAAARGAETLQKLDAAITQNELGIAAYNLALMVKRGMGVDRDDAAALSWALIAEALGHAKASDLVAIMQNELNDQTRVNAANMANEWLGRQGK